MILILEKFLRLNFIRVLCEIIAIFGSPSATLVVTPHSAITGNVRVIADFLFLEESGYVRVLHEIMFLAELIRHVNAISMLFFPKKHSQSSLWIFL